MANDRISIDDLRFPIICFGKGNVISFSRNKEELTTCSSQGFKNGFYNNLIVVDSSGMKAVVKHVRKVGSVGPFWGFNLLRSRRLKVVLDFSVRKDAIPLDELKSMIIKVFKQDEPFWDSDGELAERKEFVQHAKTPEEIIQYMTYEFYKEYK